MEAFCAPRRMPGEARHEFTKYCAAGVSGTSGRINIRSFSSPSCSSGTSTIVSALLTFQLPTIFLAMLMPSTISARRVIPRHMTMLPGGGSPLRAR